MFSVTRLTAVPALALLLLPCTAPAQTGDTPSTHGVAVANMDPSVKPGDDFYLYSNGAYIKRTTLPPDRASLGVFTARGDRRQEGRLARRRRAG